MLRPLLAHLSGKIRSPAIRALRQLGAVEVNEMQPLLRNPSPAVVREATTALLPAVP